MQHPLMQTVWVNLDTAQVWDSHVHLIGSAAAGNGAWFSPDMDSPCHPLLMAQKAFYMNAACAADASGQPDASYVTRLLSQLATLPAGFKTLLFAFDMAHDEHGQPDLAQSIFFVPNAYAAQIAQAHPARFE